MARGLMARADLNIVVHQAALGDFVLIWPMLRALRATDGAHALCVAAPSAHGALAGEAFEAEMETLDINGRDFTRLHGEAGAGLVSDAMRARFGAARRVISFVSDGEDAWASNAAQLAPDAVRFFVKTRPAADWSGHICEWHRMQLARQGLDLEQDLTTCDPRGSLRSLRGLDGEGREGIESRPSRPIVVHPGSGGRDKCWPADRFAALIERLGAAGRPVRPVLGEAEAARWSAGTLTRWREMYGAAVIESLAELHAVLSRAAGYIGNDAGPTHLAAQLGLPTVALFGPTDPAVWAPIGPAVTVVSPPTPSAMDWLSVDHAFVKVLAALGAGG